MSAFSVQTAGLWIHPKKRLYSILLHPSLHIAWQRPIFLLSWLELSDVFLQVEIMNKTLTNSCTINIFPFKKQCPTYFLVGTGWRLNSYLPNQFVMTRAYLSWPFTAFLVMVKSKILKFSICLINSRFAAGHFFANRFWTKPFLVQNYNLCSLSFR